MVWMSELSSNSPAPVPTTAPEQSLEARAKALSQAGKRAEALVCFEQLAAQQPSNAWWLIWQVSCLHGLGRWSEALTRLAQVPQQGSLVLETWRKRFALLRASGQLPQAALVLAQRPLPPGLLPLELEQRQLELARSY
jgi:predicted Zn-dependent protease